MGECISAFAVELMRVSILFQLTKNLLVFFTFLKSSMTTSDFKLRGEKEEFAHNWQNLHYSLGQCSAPAHKREGKWKGSLSSNTSCSALDAF